MKKQLLFFVILAILQIQVSAYVPEPITGLTIVAKKHFFGPLTIKQQSNAFIDGVIWGSINAFGQCFSAIDEKNPTIKDASKIFVTNLLVSLQCIANGYHINSGKSLSLFARAAGFTISYVVMIKVCSHFNT